MQVFLSERAKAALRVAPPASKKALRDALHALQRGKVAALDAKELRQAAPGPKVYRLRVGTWRVVFRVEGRRLEVLHVFPRRDGYGWLERV